MTVATRLILALKEFPLVGVSGLCLAALALLGSSAQGAEPAHGFLNRVYKDPDGVEVKYVVFVPHSYKGDEPFPLILFLHGSGETRGGKKQPVEVGLGPAIKKREKSFPFFAIFPQSQDRTWRAGSRDAKRALAILERVQKEYKIDPDQIHLTGLSMGGFGTWSLAAKYPERWATITPICGGARGQEEKVAAAVKNLPCWDFHGDADQAVPVSMSRKMMAALWAAGAHPNYTEYPGVGHNSWDKAYATPDLYDWMLKLHRAGSSKSAPEKSK
jgi:predicted peptidase